MSIQVSLKLSALLGRRVVLTCEFEGYPSGSVAIIEQFLTTVEGSVFVLLFETLPGSLEEVEPLMLPQIARFSKDSGGHSLSSYFKQGFPLKEKSFNLSVS